MVFWLFGIQLVCILVMFFCIRVLNRKMRELEQARAKLSEAAQEFEEHVDAYLQMFIS